MDDLLTIVVKATPPAASKLEHWWAATAAVRAAGASTIDRALIAGAHADRLGFAFAGAYSEALRALVPSLGDRVAALCATEEHGAHPRAIRTTLVADGAGGFRLTGHKRWATGGTAASELIVLASVGHDGARNLLRAVRVPVGARGVRLRASAAPFVPEVPHAEVELTDVPVPAADALPGDGYDDYLKPFRTVEDLHVHAALFAYLAGAGRRHRLAEDLVERALALAATARGLADLPPLSPALHLALAGLLDLAAALVEQFDRAFTATAGDEQLRWARDRPLLRIAASARAARRQRARTALLPPANWISGAAAESFVDPDD